MSFYYLLNQYTVCPTYTSYQNNYLPFSSIVYLQPEILLNSDLAPQPEIQNSIESNYPQNQRPQIIKKQVKQKKILKQRKKDKKIKRKNKEKLIQSAKKNSQSNIVNQLFAFFNLPQKSCKIVERAIKLLGRSSLEIQKILSIFYNIIRLMYYKGGRKYKNKQSIKQYYKSSQFIEQIPEIRQKLQKINIITLEEFCKIFRMATYYFVKYISISSILTSKRIVMGAKKLHLIRRRIVLERFQENSP